MRTIIVLLATSLVVLSNCSYSQSNYSWKDNKLILDNGAIKRTIEYNNDKQTFVTTSIFHGNNEGNFISSKASMEFSFVINGATYTGQNKWEYVKQVTARDDKQGKGVTVTIQGTG
ncbi:MAG: hypothetical protein KAQ79_21065, partial [Cyclobacteriaceae bacterium]|nr:hypothetical protein [Cyclobacteriaceae bacterium]